MATKREIDTIDNSRTMKAAHLGLYAVLGFIAAVVIPMIFVGGYAMVTTVVKMVSQ